MFIKALLLRFGLFLIKVKLKELMWSMASIITLMFLSMDLITNKKIEVHFFLPLILLGVLSVAFGVVAFVVQLLLTLIGVVNFVDFMRLMIGKKCGGWLGR
jgi:cellobiose-specific phosphotransferase system component IIC